MPSKLRSDITPEQRAIGERLQEALDRNELTHKEFADQVGRKLRTVEGWVAGEFSPRSRALEIERILGIPADYLLYGRGPRVIGSVATETDRLITYGEFSHWRKSMEEELDRLRKMIGKVEAKTNGKRS